MTIETIGSLESRIKVIDKPYLEEDVPREPVKLREIEPAEFREISAADENFMRSSLKETIGNTPYDSFQKLTSLVKAHNERPTINSDLLETYTSLEINSHNTLEQGTTCVGMSLKLKAMLKENGIHSYLVRFQAGGLVCTSANTYADIGHSALVVPGMENGEKTYTLLDPGLMISEPLKFVEGKDSLPVEVGDKRYQVVEDQEIPNTDGYQYMLVVSKRSKDPNTGEQTFVEKDRIYFDPTHELLNPDETISKQTMRATSGAKITRQDQEGKNLGYFQIDLPNREIAMCIGTDKFNPISNSPRPGKIPFDRFSEIANDEETYRGFEYFSNFLHKEPGRFYTEINDVINISTDYVSKIYAPSVRSELMQTGRLSSYEL